MTSSLTRNNIAICALQETKIIDDFPLGILYCGNFNLELEDASLKKRVGFYIRNDIRYKRRRDLENKDLHIIIIDVNCYFSVVRIINVYRSFRPPRVVTANDFFKAHLDLLEQVTKGNCVILGDFNLDARMEHNMDYKQKNLLEPLINFALRKSLIQRIDFTTWSCNINGILKQFLLDHVYVTNLVIV